MASAGYSYGIDGLSKGTSDANFVLNQGTNRDVNVRAFSILIDSGTSLTLKGTSLAVPSTTPVTVSSSITTPAIIADSIRFGPVSVVGAGGVTIMDFSTTRNLAAFKNSYVFFQVGDGQGSSGFGSCFVGPTGTLSSLVFTQGSLLAPVTAVSATIATTVLTVVFTDKVATSTGLWQVTSCTA